MTSIGEGNVRFEVAPASPSHEKIVQGDTRRGNDCSNCVHHDELKSVRRMTSGFEDIAKGNSEFVACFTHGDVPGKPARNMLLITCMDCRIVPHQALGLTFGDMKVIRNGGGQVNPEVEKDVVIANNILECDRILIMQHTRCGMAAATLEKVREVVHANTGADVSEYYPDVISDQKAKLVRGR